jgi:phosphomannomutase/phosphoglucomutase
VESEQGWGLVRVSNTQPALVFRFEANDEEGLPQIQELFRSIMKGADPKLKLPF